MNRHNGLLAFVCTVVATTAAALQIPVNSGFEMLGRRITSPDLDEAPPLAIALTPPTAARIPLGIGGTDPLTLSALQRERRIDAELQTSAANSGIPWHVLKAHLAQSCRGVLDSTGHYWARLPEGEAEVEDNGRARTRAAAELLGRYRRQTGSVFGALLAWKASPTRAARVSQTAGPSLEQHLAALRNHMIAPYRSDAERWLCTVWGLALALRARWPVANRDVSQGEGRGVRLLTRPAEQVAAAMPGRVGHTGLDGPRGLCVEVVHACGLRTELCDLRTVRVKIGQQVRAGSVLGTAGAIRPRFNLWLDDLALDVAQLLEPDGPG